MIYFVALIPATALAIAGYFVLFLSNRSEGAFRTVGRYLGFWAFTLAGLIVLGAIFAAAHGRHHGVFCEHGMDGRMHGRWAGRPRFCEPRTDGPRDGDRLGETQQGVTPGSPTGASSPATQQGPETPAPH